MKRINFQLDELQAFAAVAEKQSFRAAAESLYLSPPALSRRIERLEVALNARLFERTTRRLSLTAVGRQFLEHAHQVLETLQTAVEQVSDATALRRGVVTVACVPSVAERMLPEALSIFCHQYPEVRVKVVDEGAQEVLAQVIQGQADFGINFMGAQEPGLDFRKLCRESYWLAVRPDHALAGRASVAWAELVDERVISVARSSGNRLLLDNALSRLSPRPSVFHEANHVATLLRMVEAGLGVGAVPGLALPGPQQGALNTVVGVPLVKPTIHRVLGLISRRDQALSPAAAALYAQLRRGASAPTRPLNPP